MCSLFASSEDRNENQLEKEESQIVYDDLSRRDVRSLLFHLLYAADAFNYEESVQSIIDSFNRGFDLNIPLHAELAHTFKDIIDHRHELEKIYEPYLANWRTDRISVCTKLILLFAIWELKNTETDTRIVINEAIELAKCFAEQDAYRFINGILDPISKEFRKEINTEN